MLINHPLLGPRDSREFYVLGSADLLKRPDWQSSDVFTQFHNYVHMRENPYGEHKELWYHEQGDRSWLVVTRDTATHEIYQVELACDVARRLQNGGTL
ncbi:MAG: sarcosine oxidase subunit delta [Pseudomonadota bacterium]